MAEVDELRAEVARLRERQASDLVAGRIRERDEEYRYRLMELELAATGIKPIGVDPRARIHGAAAFVELLAGLDSDAAFDAVKSTVASIHRNGYAIVDGLLSQMEIEHLRDGMSDLFERTRRLFTAQPADRPGDHQTVHVQNVLAKTDVADAVASKPALRAVIAGVLGHDFILNAGAVAMSPDPGCSPQGLHRDDGFYALLPRPHMPLVVTAAIALDDFTRVNGGTQLLPGSHLWPAERMPEPEDVIWAEMRAGSVLLWDGAMYHGGGGNRTRAVPRRTLTLNYTRGWLRTQFNHYLSVPRERILAMPPALQRDLGYHRSALGLGGCDLQDPLEYLRRLTAAGGDGAQHMLGRDYPG